MATKVIGFELVHWVPSLADAGGGIKQMPTSQPANDPVDTSLGTIEGQPVMTVDWGKNRKLHIPLSNVLWLKTEAAE